MGGMKAGERRFLVITGAAILSATLIPYLFGAFGSPVGSSFAWGVGFLPDTLGNLPFTRQAADGSILFMNPYTGEPHPAMFFNPFFLLVGWAQRLTGLPPGLVFQLARLLAALALFHAVAVACRALFPSVSGRRTAFLLVFLSGGLGFLSVVFPWFQRSADIRGAEITTFFSVYQQAHFAAALAIIVWMAAWLAKALQTGSLRNASVAGALNLLLVSVHPYDAPVPYAVATVYCLLIAAVRSRPVQWKPLLVFLAVPLPLLAWDGYVSTFVPVYRDYAQEGLVALPWPITDYLTGYGPLALLAIPGLAAIFRERNPAWLLPAAWALTVPVLMLLPVPARRKLLEGYHLFLALVAARGVLVLRDFLPLWTRPLAPAGLVLLSLSSVYVMSRDMYSISVSRRPERPGIRMEGGQLLYPLNRPVDRLFIGDPWLAGIFMRRVDRYDLPDGLLEAASWMARNLPRDRVVLAAPETGLLVPMFTPHRVVIGHIFGTLRWPEKEMAVRVFMDPFLPDPARQILLRRYQAGAVLRDPALDALGNWRPGAASAGWLKRAASFGSCTVYLVDLPPAGDAGDSDFVAREIEAGFLKAAGFGALAAGDPVRAGALLGQALRLRPMDPEIRAMLSEAQRR